MKLTALCIIIHPFLILSFSALAVSTSGGLEGITNPGFHGLSQVLYEYASSAANNGSGFEGLADNSYFWNITAGLAMFFGRYLSIVIQLAIAGSLMRKRFVNETVGTLRTDTAILRCDLGVRSLHLRSADLLPRAGAWPHCRASDSVGLRRAFSS